MYILINLFLIYLNPVDFWTLHLDANWEFNLNIFIWDKIQFEKFSQFCNKLDPLYIFVLWLFKLHLVFLINKSRTRGFEPTFFFWGGEKLCTPSTEIKWSPMAISAINLNVLPLFVGCLSSYQPLFFHFLATLFL